MGSAHFLKIRIQSLCNVLLLTLLSLSTLSAQKTDFGLSLNSGLFSIAGRSATSTSAINNDADLPASNYTNNPYGSRVGDVGGTNDASSRILRFGLQYWL